MNDNIENIIRTYIKDNLSPKITEKDYISEKYEELKSFLKFSCFRSGSYARYTAVSPVHDLDVIHPVTDPSLESQPNVVLDSLYALLEEGYENSKISKIKQISRQSHSITVDFADCKEPFSIDVVPAIELKDEPLNEYGKPFYRVPEIYRLNKFNRLLRYETAGYRPIQWIKTDPHGYLRSSVDLNNTSPNFRRTVKLGKGWRHACKVVYGDNFRFKSFHFELMFHRYFTKNSSATILEAAIDCFGEITQSLTIPQFMDRADNNRFVDGYVTTLTPKQAQLIAKLQSEAYNILLAIQKTQDSDRIQSLLKSLMNIKKTNQQTVSFASVISTPRQPWGY